MIPTRAHSQPAKVQNPLTPPHPPIERNAQSVHNRLPRFAHQTRSGRCSSLLLRVRPASPRKLARKIARPPASWPGPACSHLYLPCSVKKDCKSAVPTTLEFS
ncbi:unnamed protein product [Urochloa humidicola]